MFLPDFQGQVTAMTGCVFRTCGSLFFAALVFSASDVQAEESETAWMQTPNARIRMINAVWDGKDPARIGIEIELEPGWKTYWRHPGDAGVPPRFDWSQSANLRSSRVIWPAPDRFGDEYGTSIGYKNKVVLPVELVPLTAGRPIRVALKFDYALCADVCIPAEAGLTLEVNPGGEAGPVTKRLQAWIARAPLASPAGGFTIGQPEAFLKDGKAMVKVMISRLNGLTNPDLFAEGPETVYVTVPRRVKQEGDKALFHFSADGADTLAELRKIKLRLTARNGGKAVERQAVIR